MLTRRECWCQDFSSSLTDLMKHTVRERGHSRADRGGGRMKHRERDRQTERTADEATGTKEGL